MSDGKRSVAAFRYWHDSWWKNAPNTVAEANALDAFLAGWAAKSEDVEALEDALLALIPVPQVSTYVKDWPKDEQEMFRDPKWFSFTMRGEALDLYRRQKIVKQIIALIRGA